uniref:HDOD domain-containing protein n=1 Tax=Thaumasiovibrio occultus TaxID=1891184 RepID=UPI000B357DF2|nr:HDOD domain-containing protein [Thaumasiovibrio occultus]
MSHLALMWHTPNKQRILASINTDFYQLVTNAIKEDRLALPPIPDVVIRLHSLCQDHDSTVRDVADALADDPSLTASVIRVANSVIFNRVNAPCHDISAAVSRLGMFRVRDIVTAQAIEELKNSAVFSEECNKLLEESATQSRQLAGATTLVCEGIIKYSETPTRLEPEKALLSCILADIGLFSLVKEYQHYLEQGNFLDLTLAKEVFASVCSRASVLILRHWGFDQDFLEVAGNTHYSQPDEGDVRYVDLARMANHLLMFRSQDEAIDEHEVEFDLAGAETMYELSNLSEVEFKDRIDKVMQKSCL